MEKYFLIINAGSSSVKLSAIPTDKKPLSHYQRALIEINNQSSHKTLSYEGEKKEFSENTTIAEIISHWINDKQLRIAAIGHRVVHGGKKFTDITALNEQVIEEIDGLSPFAPLHNPYAVSHMRNMSSMGVKQFAYFDTAFHSTIPEVAHRFAIEEKFYQGGIRRYGFHGIAYESVLQILQQFSPDVDINTTTNTTIYKNKTAVPEKIVAIHLGNGCSMCAIKNGSSLDTTMSFTPLDGLIMGTRSGSIDPGAVNYISKNYGITLEETITSLLNKKSGLLGVSGLSSDMRELLANYENDSKCRLAIEMFCYRISGFLHSFIGLLEGIDIIIFSGGIGENSGLVREKIISALQWMGITVDREKNMKVRGMNPSSLQFIQGSNSSCKVAVVAINEEEVIADKIRKL